MQGEKGCTTLTEPAGDLSTRQRYRRVTECSILYHPLQLMRVRHFRLCYSGWPRWYHAPSTGSHSSVLVCGLRVVCKSPRTTMIVQSSSIEAWITGLHELLRPSMLSNVYGHQERSQYFKSQWTTKVTRTFLVFSPLNFILKRLWIFGLNGAP